MIENGARYYRGVDMKSAIACFTARRCLATAGLWLISLLITGDEEEPTSVAARAALAWLTQQGSGSTIASSAADRDGALAIPSDRAAR